MNTPSPSPQTVKPNLVLGICCMSLLLVGMDVTIVNVALPAIEHDLHASLTDLQWVVDAYTLVVASLLMLSGSMSDRFGRRRVFQIGLTLFCAGSLLCSLAHSIGALVLFRAMQGLGASMLNPVALSIIANAFPKPQDRARAIGTWGAVSGLSFAIGPIIGGALTQAIGWRSIFWINLPIGLAALLLTARFVPESKAPRARPFDPGGQALVFLTLTALTYGVIEGPRSGWAAPDILGLFATAAVAFVLLLVYESRRRDPLLDLRFFRSVPFSSATVLGVLSFSCFAGYLFLNALYLQQARGFSALHTGLSTLPIAIGMTLFPPLSGKLVGKHGTLPSLLFSGACLVISTAMLTHLSVHTSLVWIMVSYGIFGSGIGAINPAITNSAVAGMPLSQAGLAAAIASTGRQVGAALGVAVAGTVVNASHTAGIDFTHATHPIWWIMTACGAIIFALGIATNTARARATSEDVRALLA